MAAKYVVKETKTGFNFALKASNGEVVCTSEGYTTLKACLNGVKSVAKNAIAKIVEE